jgi:isochorismate synthase
MKIIDYIRYRIPGEEITIKAGILQLLEEGVVPKGFVLTSFKGDKVYQFTEDAHDGTFFSCPEPEETSKSDYLRAAENFISKLRANGGKAVLSRIKKTAPPADEMDFFEKLCEQYPNAFVYTFLSTNLGAWIGATPETLLSAENGMGETMALAGTRVADSFIPWTEKEFEEHELVADFIEDGLKKVQVNALQRSKRKETISGPVKHLLTEFQFEVDKANTWKLAKSLHPTPAVSGWPVAKSLELIEQQEKHDRSFYAGIVGVVGDKTNLYVNLRCAELGHNGMYLYLGGGFTKDSVAEEEWIETENKAATLMNVLKNG